MPDLLKFITCGSVDDGKSTLIGHMLYDAKLLFADQEQALELESRVGSRGGEMDYSLLLDGLMAEREQGITIDVAYRYFSTERRSFIVADTPGHEEYTGNMAVGASFAELAVILVDATQGILKQTRRHARICSLMGIRDYCFAVNKMDLVGWQPEIFAAIEGDLKGLAAELGDVHIAIIPVSATSGDNVTLPSSNMEWYHGPALLSYLETVEVSRGGTRTEGPDNRFVLPVQRVCRPDASFRGFEGQIEAGAVAVGEPVSVLPSGEQAKVQEILSAGRRCREARAGMPVTLVLDREVDVSRGCVLERDGGLHVADLFRAEILWTDDEPLAEGKSFLLKLGTQELPASVMEIRRMNIDTGEFSPTSGLQKNEIAACTVSAARKIVFAPFAEKHALGSFILIDRVTNHTVACGVVRNALRRTNNLVWQEMEITRQLRAKRMEQTPRTLWFTGLSGSGKSTIANILEKKLFAQGRYTMLLDGDNVRMGLNGNLGFAREDRMENLRRVAEVAKLMNDAGLIVLVSFISPYRMSREQARRIIGPGNFVEIYLDASVEECEARDVKGFYRKAREGKIPDFTGITSPYEVPEHPELILHSVGTTPEACAEQVIEYLEKCGKQDESF